MEEEKDQEHYEASEGEATLLVPTTEKRRSDKGRIHATHHGVLARHLLEAARYVGEDPKALRRLEKRFREELRPKGVISELLFDRFWAAHIRCLLAAREEARIFLQCNKETQNKSTTETSIVEAEVPTLVIRQTGLPNPTPAISQDILHHLVLIQRYDRRFAGEMLQSLALLLVLRNGGEAALEKALASSLGIWQ